MSVGSKSGFSESCDILEQIERAADEDIDLAAGALALAGLTHIEVSLEPYRAHLAELASDLAAAAVADTPAARAAALTRVMYDRHGYSGDSETYDDLQNADLMRVIDRRKGLPVALGILLIHAGRSQGWPMVGLNFPGHFLVRLEGRAGRLILDPFARARPLDTEDLRLCLKSFLGERAELLPQHCEPVGNRAILLRLQNNLKRRLIQAGALERAATVIARMQRIAPAEVELLREEAQIAIQLGRLRRAIYLLDKFKVRAPRMDQRCEATALLEQLSARLN